MTTEKQNQIARILIIIFALAGMAVMGYLLYVHYSPEEGSFCNLGEGLSCDIVNKSIYAKILGIPMSLLGLLYFVGVLFLSFFKYTKDWLKKALFISIIFLGPSLYLSFVEFFILENVCVFCELSKILILALIITICISIKAYKFGAKFWGFALVLAVLLGFGTYFIQTNTGGVPEGRYDEFAVCLNDENFVMYGSVTCAFCARQRALFGSAFDFIEEVECDPRNKDNESSRCIAKNVERTPTWIREDEEGRDLLRFDPGVVSLEKLSEASGCALP